MKTITTKEFVENIYQCNNIHMRFDKIIKETKQSITVLLRGRTLNGSYTYEQEQVSEYLSELNIAFNGEVIYIGGGNVYTYGEYIFEFENTSWNVVGRLYAASGYEAFAIDYGETWATMYRMYKGLKFDDDNLYSFVGLRLNNEQELLFDDKKIFKCLDFKDDVVKHFKGHNSDSIRTYFHALFDCYISESEIMEIYIEINKRVLNHNIKIQDHKHKLSKIIYKPVQHSSPRIYYTFSDNTHNDSFRVGDCLLKPLQNKTLTNRDLTVQNFNINDTFNKDGYTATITDVTYTIKDGFSYAFNYKQDKGTVYSSINQMNLLKIKPATRNINSGEFSLIGMKFYYVDVVGKYNSDEISIVDAIPETINYLKYDGFRDIYFNRYSLTTFKDETSKFYDMELYKLQKRLMHEIKVFKKKSKRLELELTEFNALVDLEQFNFIKYRLAGIKPEILNKLEQNNLIIAQHTTKLVLFGKARRYNKKLLQKIEYCS